MPEFTHHSRGFTLLELIIVTVMITVLASMILPLMENSIKREQEVELRRALRDLRTAIDNFKKFVDEQKIKVDEDTYGYPEKLEDLVKGLEYKDKSGNSRIMHFLRKIPYDPVTRSYEWGMRSYQDKITSSRWGGENIWDVYCSSEKRALNGTYYRDW